MCGPRSPAPRVGPALHCGVGGSGLPHGYARELTTSDVRPLSPLTGRPPDRRLAPGSSHLHPPNARVDTTPRRRPSAISNRRRRRQLMAPAPQCARPFWLGGRTWRRPVLRWARRRGGGRTTDRRREPICRISDSAGAGHHLVVTSHGPFQPLSRPGCDPATYRLVCENRKRHKEISEIFVAFGSAAHQSSDGGLLRRTSSHGL